MWSTQKPAQIAKLFGFIEIWKTNTVDCADSQVKLSPQQKSLSVAIVDRFCGDAIFGVMQGLFG